MLSMPRNKDLTDGESHACFSFEHLCSSVLTSALKRAASEFEMSACCLTVTMGMAGVLYTSCSGFVGVWVVISSRLRAKIGSEFKMRSSQQQGF